MTEFQISLCFEFKPTDYFFEIRFFFQLFGPLSLRVKENCRVSNCLRSTFGDCSRSIRAGFFNCQGSPNLALKGKRLL